MENNIADRNKPLTDEEVVAMFPQEGYMFLDPSTSHVFFRFLQEENNIIHPLVLLLASQVQKYDKVRNNNLAIHSIVQHGIHRCIASGENSVGVD
ncbi:hypothetical protein SUGI_0600890 [Cryptomeria japonica]|nr:hypothetical protein SUGI_0600890 [Cryptomeria japonica]